MSIGFNQTARGASTGDLVENVLNETGEFLESKNATWFRRALPLVLRFGFSQPVLGSVFGIVNIYYGLGNSIVNAHREVRKAAKYWGFIHGNQWAAGQLTPRLTCARLRLLPGKGFNDLRKSTRFSNQRKGGIEVSNQTYCDEFRSGIADAVGSYNKLFEGIEKQIGRELMHMVTSGASQMDRQKAYHEAASRLRFVGAKGLYHEVSSNLPPTHVKEMLGY